MIKGRRVTREPSVVAIPTPIAAHAALRVMSGSCRLFGDGAVISLIFYELQ
jgi:hypothetical protein